jgi:hypothetical protein
MHNDNKKTARMAGVWWLLFILIGPVSYLVVDGKLLAPGDPAATISNIDSNMALFWAGVAAFFAGYACFILLGKTLYKLFVDSAAGNSNPRRSNKPIESRLAMWMMALVITGTALVLTGKIAEIAAAYAGNVENAAYLFNLRANIEMVGELFWGLWLIPLVILIFKSNLIPKVISGAVLLAVAYHLAAFVIFFIGDADVSAHPALVALGTIGELSMVLWLLIKGVKAKEQT